MNAQWEHQPVHPTQHVQILTEITHVHAILVMKEMDGHHVVDCEAGLAVSYLDFFCTQILMSVLLEQQHVNPIQHVQTLQGAILVHATMDTKETVKQLDVKVYL